MIDASHFGDVVDVIDQRAQRRAWNLRRPFAFDSIVIEIRDGFPAAFSCSAFALTAASRSLACASAALR